MQVFHSNTSTYFYSSDFFGEDEKEDSILGSILLPSFHISMLSVDDHISRKYAFKVKHKCRDKKVWGRYAHSLHQKK